MSSPDHVLGNLHVPGDPVPGGSVESRWLNMRRRRIPLWIGLTAGSIVLAVAIVIRLISEWNKPYIGSSEITGGIVFLVASVLVALWMVWVTPRVFTRQGVAADAIGVALIQEPNLWFGGKTVRIPWDVIHSVTEEVRYTSSGGEGRRKRMIVRMAVDSTDHDVAVPSWASALPVPSSQLAPAHLRIDISAGNSWHPRILRLLSEAQPDFGA